MGIVSGNIQDRYSFDDNDIRIVRDEKGSIVSITIDGAYKFTTPGVPDLPVFYWSYILPEDRTVSEIEIIYVKSDTIEGVYDIPSIPSYILPGGRGTGDTLNKNIYNSKVFWPGDKVRFKRDGFLQGCRIGYVEVYPVQWNPGTGQLILNKEILFELRLEVDGRVPLHREVRYKEYEESLRGFLYTHVRNKGDIERWVRRVFTLEDEMKNGPLAIPYPPKVEIITRSEYSNALKPLKDWLCRKGEETRITSLSYIMEMISEGRDIQEKIRNYIKTRTTAYFFILGGDVEIIPTRLAYGPFISSGITNVPTDLYYSCLDGNWDKDNDGVYAEIGLDEDGDGIPDRDSADYSATDIEPDVWVSRLPFNSVAEAERMVNKILKYERDIGIKRVSHEVGDGVDDWVLLLGAAGPHSGGMALDTLVKRGSLNDPDWLTLLHYAYRVYDDKGVYWPVDRDARISSQKALHEMNNKYGFICHQGHGQWDRIFTNYETDLDDAVDIVDIDNLNNKPQYTVMYSVSCSSAVFTKTDCFGEHWLLSVNGGGPAYIGNTSVGYTGNYQPGNDDTGEGNGSGEIYNQSFVETWSRYSADCCVYLSGCYLGDCLGWGKVATYEKGYHKKINIEEYSLNSLGSSIMPLLGLPGWKDDLWDGDTLRRLKIESVREVEGGYEVKVTALHGNNYIGEKNVKVALYDGYLLWWDWTDDKGEVIIPQWAVDMGGGSIIGQMITVSKDKFFMPADTVMGEVSLHENIEEREIKEDKERITITEQSRDYLGFEIGITGYVEISLYDIQGKKIDDIYSDYVDGKKKVTYDWKELSRGVYFIRAEMGDESITEKIIKIR